MKNTVEERLLQLRAERAQVAIDSIKKSESTDANADADAANTVAAAAAAKPSRRRKQAGQDAAASSAPMANFVRAPRNLCRFRIFWQLASSVFAWI